MENVNGPEDHAHVSADITLETDPNRELQAQLHVVDSLTEDDLIVEPDRGLTTAGDTSLTWDFSDRGYANRIQFSRFPPNVFIIFSDGDTEVRVTVMSVEYS